MQSQTKQLRQFVLYQRVCQQDVLAVRRRRHPVEHCDGVIALGVLKAVAWSVAEERVDESDALQRLAEPSRLRGSSLLSLRKHLHTDSHMKRAPSSWCTHCRQDTNLAV